MNKKMLVVSIDLGYRYVKAINSRRERVMFPSAVSPVVSGDLNGILSGEQGKNSIDVKKMRIALKELKEGKEYEEYYVGEIATKQKQSAIPFDENKINHIATKVLVSTANSLLTTEFDSAVHVTAGLPLMQFTHQQDELDNYLHGLNLNFKFLFSDNTEMRRKVWFNGVTLFPQGFGAVYYAITQKYKHLLHENGVRLGLVDVGGKTTEAVMFRTNSGGVDSDLDRCDTFDLGTSFVEERLRRHIQSAYGYRLENNEMYEILRSGRFYYDNENIDVGWFVEKARSELSQAIKDELGNLWGKEQKRAYLIMWAGGGAKDIMVYVKTKNSVLIDNAQFANAIGNMIVAGIETGTVREIPII